MSVLGPVFIGGMLAIFVIDQIYTVFRYPSLTFRDRLVTGAVVWPLSAAFVVGLSWLLTVVLP